MTAEIIYKGELQTEMKHIHSGSIVITDAPLDNQGKGESFSPTDLVASATGSCALTIMGIAARTHGINILGAKVTVLKLMANQPRKISELKLEFRFPENNFSEKEKAILENAARTCPVILSLNPEINIELKFHY